MKYDSTYSALRELNRNLGGVDERFDSEYSIWRNINNTLGGVDKNYDSTYSILESLHKNVGGVVLNLYDLDFTQIGYDEADTKRFNVELFRKNENDVKEYSGLDEEWNSIPNRTWAEDFYVGRKFIFSPNINTSNVTTMRNMFGGCTNLTFLADLNTSNVKTMATMFNNCRSLPTIPQLDTSSVTNMTNMFYGCYSLTSLPLLDTSNVTNMNGMFKYCTLLPTIPLLDTSNVKDMGDMFYGCYSLTTIPQIDTSNVTRMSGMFSDCSSLTSLPLLDCGSVTGSIGPLGYGQLNSLTDIGGFKDLKVSWTSACLNSATSLTVESLMNVINNLYDLTANGLSGQTLKFGTTNLQKLTADQIAVATNKGWTLN